MERSVISWKFLLAEFPHIVRNMLNCRLKRLRNTWKLEIKGVVLFCAMKNILD